MLLLKLSSSRCVAHTTEANVQEIAALQAEAETYYKENQQLNKQQIALNTEVCPWAGGYLEQIQPFRVEVKSKYLCAFLLKS